MRIFLDMDDTITDFQKAFINVTDMEPLKFKEVMMANLQRMGVEKKDAAEMFVFSFWVTVHMQPLFWEKMPPKKDFKKLWRYLKKYNPIILTAVPEFPQFRNLAVSGKRQWINKNMSTSIHMLTIDLNSYDHTKMDKAQFCNGDQDILIDDNRKNVEAWIENGGRAIQYVDAKHTILELKAMIKQIKG
jgi:hypothetical protein